MQLTGKVIIFKDEEEAKMWYKVIAEANYNNELERTKMGLEEYKVIYDIKNG